MKKILFLLAFIISMASCKQKLKKQSTSENDKPATVVVDTLLITDTSWGLINSQHNFSDLKVMYGEVNIKDERICGPECVDSIDVTKLYPDTKNEAIIYWQDSAYHKKIGMILCYNDSATYHTSSGIKIGSGVQQLLTLNGKPIKFYGFGWDYGGNIISYNDGALEKSPIHFELDIRSAGGDDDNNLYGDTELSTDMPKVQKALDKMFVGSISLSFYQRE